MTYIALLRGINVGGHTVKMERMRELFTELGFDRVRSYIQTGNIFFDSDESEEACREKIESHLEKNLGYAVPTFLRTIPELEAIMQANPFKHLTVTDDMRLTVTFFEGQAQTVALPLISPKQDSELIAIIGREAYVVWYILKGRPPASFKYLEGIFPKQNTTRFFHTLGKILEAAKQD